MTRSILTIASLALIASAPVLAADTSVEVSVVADAASEPHEEQSELTDIVFIAPNGLSFDGEVVLAHPGRRPHPNPHNGRRNWMDGRRHGGHFGATARLSFAHHQALRGSRAGHPAIDSVGLGLEVRSGKQDSFSMSLLLEETNVGLDFGYRRYLAGDFDRGLFAGAIVGEWGLGVPGYDTARYLFAEGVVGAKYTDRRGLTLEIGAGTGMFAYPDVMVMLFQGFVTVGQSI
jgi:hypothetical protein